MSMTSTTTPQSSTRHHTARRCQRMLPQERRLWRWLPLILIQVLKIWMFPPPPEVQTENQNVLKTDIFDEWVCGMKTSDTTLISIHIPYAVSPLVNRVGLTVSTGSQTGLGVPGNSSKFQIVRLPHEPALSACGETACGHGNRVQHGTASLCAADFAHRECYSLSMLLYCTDMCRFAHMSAFMCT